MDPDALLESFRAVLSVSDDPDCPQLQRYTVALESDDWDDIDEAASLYQWLVLASIELEDGEVRRCWRSGWHDDCNLVDNPPMADLCVPRAPKDRAGRVVCFRGWLRYGERGPTSVMEWSCRLPVDAPETPVALEPSDESRLVTEITFSGPQSAVHPEVVRLPVEVDPVLVCACLPGIGLVSASQGMRSFRLHTPNGTDELKELNAVLASLPGATRGPPDAYLVGGPRGRLAVHSPRSYGYDRKTDSTRVGEHLVLFELPSQRVLSMVAPDASGQSTYHSGYARFDQEGERYVCHFAGRVRMFDVATGRDLGDFVAATEAVPRAVDMGSPGRAQGAWSETARVGAWPARDTPGLFPSHSLCVFHPSWGVRQHCLPEGAEVLGVLSEGRVVVAGESVLLVDAETGHVADLGPVRHCAPRELLQERGDERVLWTYDPARWCLRWRRIP